MDYDKIEKEFYAFIKRNAKDKIKSLHLSDEKKAELYLFVEKTIQEYGEIKRRCQRLREINTHSIELMVSNPEEMGYCVGRVLAHLIRKREANRTALPFPYPFSVN